jgi:hypothetical protein
MEIPKYKMVEKEDVDYYGFKISEGEYKDVVYFYGEVHLKENVDEDQATISFKFQIDKGNEQYSIEELNESSEFKTLIGDILATLLDGENNEDD